MYPVLAEPCLAKFEVGRSYLRVFHLFVTSSRKYGGKMVFLRRLDFFLIQSLYKKCKVDVMSRRFDFRVE